MIKRAFLILFVVIILLVLSPVAYADVVFSNDFFDLNQNKTEPVNREFCVNGADGYVYSREAPGSRKEVNRYANGSVISISAVYNHRGKYWGITPTGHGPVPDWFPMDELLTYYSSADFETGHKDELYDYTGDFDSLRGMEDFYIWQWPGSDREKIHYFVDEYSGFDYEYALRARHAFTDEKGRQWVYVVIWEGFSGGLSHSGSTEGWICLSDMDNDQIPAFNPAPEPAKWIPPGLEEKPDSVAEKNPAGEAEKGPALESGNDAKNADKLTAIIVVASSLIIAVCLTVIIVALVKYKTGGK